MYAIRKVEVNAVANRKHATFLAEVFNNPQLFTEEYIKWQYADHPAGEIIGYNALYENEIAAHFVLQPFPAIFEGKARKGLLAFNTATKKDHRGKGLFTRLAKKTMEDAIVEGYEFIVAVTNHDSVNGFTKNLGFQLVCKLPVKIGLGKIRFDKPGNDIIFEKFWDEQLWDWRLANPLNKYSFVDGYDKGYYSKTQLPLVKAFLLEQRQNNFSSIKNFGWKPFNLYIGLNKNVNFSKGLFLKIPESLKPSPLFLIFRDLIDTSKHLDKDRIIFNLIDFDAY